jgi:hypothetical protein
MHLEQCASGSLKYPWKKSGNHSGSPGSEFNRQQIGIAFAGFNRFVFTDEGDS